jgi:hypothetical protein
MQQAAAAKAAAMAILAAAALAPVAAQNTGAAQQQFADFTIRNYVKLRSQFDVERITVQLSGPRLSVSSPQYDMTAPQIQMTARKGGKPARFKVTTGTATGGVRIVVRQPEAQRTTIVNCDTAVYTASADPAATTGRIDLKGDVRSETRDPAFARPLVNTADSGVIELLGRNRTTIELNNGSSTLTPIEPRPRNTPNR